MAKINSKQKGKRYEREVVSMFKKHGYDCRRSQQYCGYAEGDSDVVGIKYLNVECKHVERLNIYDAVEQSKRDSKKSNTIPVLIHRKNNHESLVTMTFEDWIKLYKEFELNNSVN